MAQTPFPTSALADNRAGRLTAEQIRDLRLDARKSRSSGLLAGVALAAMGLFIVWGTLAGRIPGSRLQSLAVGAAFAIGGGLLLASGGMTRGPRAEQAASASTVLELVEGPFRRERSDLQSLEGHAHASRGNARYSYRLFVGDRSFSVAEEAYLAAPDDGLVRVYVLPNSDRVINLERLSDAPPTALEARAAAMLRERFGAIPQGERPAAAKRGSTTPAALRQALLGRWQAQGMPMSLEFRADDTMLAGAEGPTAEEKPQRWEVLDGEHLRIDGEEQRVEVSGDELLLSTRGPTFRFHRVRG
jgi:hypothetical protein